jgi:single-stranded-DNA-specific exonuclease
MKKWEHLTQERFEDKTNDDIIACLLKNRGITSAKDRETFLHPSLDDVTPKTVGISLVDVKKALKRITKAIEKKEQIIIFGDYDVDGITASAILWETLHSLDAKAMPYIPSRIEEGYGLSIPGITNIIEKYPDTGLIITVDNGIVANEAVSFANEKGIDVIVTDHHTVGEEKPDAFAIVHTTNLCGAGVAYLLAKELKDSSAKPQNDRKDNHLELATLGTVADLVPLTGANRAIVKHGLEKVRVTKRLGLQELYKQAGLQKDVFSPYDIGFGIAPRLNASGRIASAMDSLRLLCTTNRERAEELAGLLESTNKERQLLMRESSDHAILQVNNRTGSLKKLLIVSHESYAPGVIGLIAGKLVESFYRPAIVLSVGEEHSKASVRSVKGFNIIDFLRSKSELFVNVGGHPMAAGFTIKTSELASIQSTLEDHAEELIEEAMLMRKLAIDCELPFSSLTKSLYKALQQLAPFGMGNPEPVFATNDVLVGEVRAIGKENAHLKLKVKQGKHIFDAIAFGMGDLASELHTGDSINLAYTLDENTWRDKTTLQLKVKDIVKKP